MAGVVSEVVKNLVERSKIAIKKRHDVENWTYLIPMKILENKKYMHAIFYPMKCNSSICEY
jgi:hypothetical protein